MFSKNLAPVWIGILCIASAFLMGQEPWGPTGPPAPVAKTGQTTSYATGDDGDLQKGVAWPVPRFTDNGDGTVTDNLTGLVWTKDADCHHDTWESGLDYCNALADGTCSLNDDSIAGDWRMANRFEMESLLDLENKGPALPTGHPFTEAQSSHYWSSTTFSDYNGAAWVVYFGNGFVNGNDKSGTYFVWCVRGGQ